MECTIWDLPRHLQSPKPENPKSLKKVSREEFGTPQPRTPKKSEKNPKSQEKSLKCHYFLDFSSFFWLFRGPGSGGAKIASGDLFETFRVFAALGSVDGRGHLNARCEKYTK